jgi:hypothetical protein
MSSRLSLFGTLLRKDLRLYGIFAALLAVLLAAAEFPNLMMRLGSLAGLLQGALQLGTMLLVLLVMYEDAIVSMKHDWLTRPIPGTTLLAAKSAFVFLAVIVPPVVGSAAYHLSQGRSLAESALSSMNAGDPFLIPLIIMALAAVTSGIRQAIIVGLSVIALMALLALGVTLIHGTVESAAATSSGWVLRRGMQGTQLIASVAILWLQYRHRHTKAARTIAGTAVAMFVALLALVTWPVVFAVQKSLGPGSAAAATLRTSLENGCFPARRLESDVGADAAVAADVTAQRFSEEHRRVAGPGAIAFATRLASQGAMPGDMLSVGHVEIRYRNAGGSPQLRPGRTSWRWGVVGPDATTLDHYWLLPSAEYQRLSAIQGVETEVNYSLSLLKPRLTVEFMADGRRSYYAGIGYCGATVDRAAATVDVDCLVPGAQPALLTANLVGAPETRAASSRPPDFTPAVLDLWGGTRYVIKLPLQDSAATAGVKVVTYEARAHFDRQITVAGVLGGPVSACPAP